MFGKIEKRVYPNKDLSKIVGKRSMLLSVFVKRILNYVKKNKLFKGNYILPDKNLSKIVGKRKINVAKFHKKILNYLKKNKLIVKKGIASTIIDDFYNLVSKKGEIGLMESSIILNCEPNDIEEWAQALEKAKLIKIVYTPFGIKFKKVSK